MIHPSTSSLPLEKQRRRQPPGPPWYTAIQNTFSFSRKTLDFLLKMRERYGDVVTLPTVLGPWRLVFHPDGVRHVVQENHFNYNKGGIAYQILGLVLGKGLLTNNGESWLHQRRLIQPTFHRQRVAAFGALMSETTLAWTERWEASVETQRPLDLLQEMSSLTLSIVGKALFGTDMSREMKRVGQGFTTVNHLLSEAFYRCRRPNAIACMLPGTPSTPSLMS